MQEFASSVQIHSFPGLLLFLLIWIILFESAHVLVLLLRREPLIGWGIGPLGVTIMSLREPSLWLIWLDVLIPACVSGMTLYIGLFTSLSPMTLPDEPWFQFWVITFGILLTSIADVFKAWRDLRYPLWGEARLLRSMQTLRSTWSRIHFTPFGHSYVYNRFGSHPTDLLQTL